MTKTVLVTLRLTFDDLPQEVREELADGLNFRADDDHEIAPDLDAVPTLAEYDDLDLTSMIYDVFGAHGVFSGYEEQAEIWAGSDFYGYVTKSDVVEVQVKDGG